jgi:anti-sigma regulatory factor (Ser/Thr protein kinase)
MSTVRNFNIRNELGEIESLAEKVSKFCREHLIPDDIFYDVRLALEEAVSNTIKYGYGDGLAHSIEVTIQIDQQQLIIEIDFV